MPSCRLIALGGQNNQTLGSAGAEANLDAQFMMALTHPTPAVYYSTAGSPPFIPDSRIPNNTNEPYSYVRHCPLCFSTAYQRYENALVVGIHALF